MRGRAWRSGPGTGSGPVGRRTSTGRLGWPAGRRTGLLGAAVLAGALVLSGCDRGGNTDLGLALSTLNNPFFVGIKEGAQAEAERRGLHINITDAQNDPMQQIDRKSVV